MSFKSFLTAVGQDFKKGLDFALKLEPAAEVALTIADPPVAALLHVTTATIMATEQKFAAMGSQSGTGAQKAAQSIQILEPVVKSILAPYGVTVDTEYMQKYINSFVALLNLLPAFTTPATAVASSAAVLKTVAPVSQPDATANAVG
jgi:uncharacterized membrane protein